MDFLSNLFKGADPYVLTAIVVYILLGLLLIGRHKNKSNADLFGHGFTLLGFLFTIYTLLSLLNVLLFKLEEATKIFDNPKAVLGFAVVASIAWAYRTWDKLWDKSSSSQPAHGQKATVTEE